MINGIKRVAINHLEPRFYGALWITGSLMILAIFIMAFYDRSNLREEIIFVGALLAIVLATIGWIWSGRMTIIMARKTNAIHLLERISSEHVSGLKTVVYPYIQEYDNYKNDHDCAERPKMPEEQIEQLLSIYEQVSVAVVSGAVDHEIVKNSQNLVFKRIYLGLRHHIDKTQERDTKYYEFFERLTCTWHPELQKKTATFSIPGGLFSPMQGVDT